METLKNNKNILIILAVVVIGLLLYFYVFKKPEPLIVEESTSSAQLIGQELVSEINRLTSLQKISESYTSLINSPAFISLVDVEVQVQPKPIGRSNPFLSTGL